MLEDTETFQVAVTSSDVDVSPGMVYTADIFILNDDSELYLKNIILNCVGLLL